MTSQLDKRRGRVGLEISLVRGAWSPSITLLHATITQVADFHLLGRKIVQPYEVLSLGMRL